MRTEKKLRLSTTILKITEPAPRMPFYIPFLPAPVESPETFARLHFISPFPYVKENLNWNFFTLFSTVRWDANIRSFTAALLFYECFRGAFLNHSVRRTDECSECIFMCSVVCRLLNGPLLHHKPVFGNSAAMLYYLWHAWCHIMPGNNPFGN